MITVNAWLVFVPLATFLAGVGCGVLLLARPRGRAEDPWVDEAPVLRPLPAPWRDDPEPLVPEPDRLPSTDTLAGMYAELGDHDLPPAGVASSETLGPRPRDATSWDLWEKPAGERFPTIAELAEDAEYRVTWTELQAMQDSNDLWFDEAFATGRFRAVGR